ncbi:hypothetical protein C8R43DRAFT_273643 [Mycena crocata]|nr:hypothetical protein C8R43DRAFT_273643 [Mycena crocata]
MENDENHPLECLDEDRAPHRSQLGSHLDTIALRSEIHEEREPTVSGLEVARLNPARALANRGSSAEPQVLQGARNFDILGGSFLTAQSITYNITQLSPPPESHPRDTMYSPHLLQESNPERPRIPDREHVLSQHQANSSPFSLRTTSSHGASSHLNEVPLRETVTEGRSSSFLPVQPEEHIPRPTGQNPLPPTNHPAVVRCILAYVYHAN